MRDCFRGIVCCWFAVGNIFVSSGCPTLEGEEAQPELVVLTPAWIVWDLLEGWSSSHFGGVGVSSMWSFPRSWQSSAQVPPNSGRPRVARFQP